MALREWPDGWVLFDEAQGQLKCLTTSAGVIMNLLLQQTEWTSFKLGEALIEEVPTNDDVQMVENVLMHFQSLNLIERLPA